MADQDTDPCGPGGRGHVRVHQLSRDRLRGRVASSRCHLLVVHAAHRQIQAQKDRRRCAHGPLRHLHHICHPRRDGHHLGQTRSQVLVN